MSLFFKQKPKNKKPEQKSLPKSISYIRPKSSVSQLSQKETPRYTCFHGVLTLEAAVILPLMACFFISILFFFRVMQVQIEVQKALDDTGRKTAVYLAQGKEEHQTAEYALVKTIFLKELRDRKEVQKYVKGGFIGISLLESEFEEQEIHLKAEYQIPLPVRMFRMRDIQMVQRAECRKWTGRKPRDDAGSGDIWVYITETGTVYHTKRECTHLELSIRSVPVGELAWLRNENGEKYHACVLCGKKADSGSNVYITSQGDCYHKDIKCSGIKRTIYRIRLSEVGNRRACSKCSGK